MGLFDVFRKKKSPLPEDLAKGAILAVEREIADFTTIKQNFSEDVSQKNYHLALLALYFSCTKTHIFNQSEDYKSRFCVEFFRLDNCFDNELPVFCDNFDHNVGAIFRGKGRDYYPVVQSILSQVFAKACLGQHIVSIYSESFAKDHYQITIHGTKKAIHISEVLDTLF